MKESVIIDRGRGPEIAGTRITVYDIVDYLEEGWHAAAIAAFFRISSREVDAAIRYIQEHEEDVRSEYRPSSTGPPRETPRTSSPNSTPATPRSWNRCEREPDRTGEGVPRSATKGRPPATAPGEARTPAIMLSPAGCTRSLAWSTLRIRTRERREAVNRIQPQTMPMSQMPTKIRSRSCVPRG